MKWNSGVITCMGGTAYPVHGAAVTQGEGRCHLFALPIRDKKGRYYVHVVVGSHVTGPRRFNLSICCKVVFPTASLHSYRNCLGSFAQGQQRSEDQTYFLG